MHASLPQAVRSSSLRPLVALSPALLFAALAAACGGSSGGGGQSGIPGQEGTKETGAAFVVDVNQSGGASNLHLAEVLWGRLVDVHQIDANGSRVDPPVYEDFVIHPNVLTDNTRYVLDRNPVTQRERLVIQNVHGPDPGDPSPDEDEFHTLLTEASFLPLVVDKNDDGSASPPFTTVPRNACVVLRFDDCLDDDEPVALPNLVRVFSGYPPITPYATRVVFDPNHGAMVGGSYHATRVLVDMTVSETEAADPDGPPLDVNAIGLPPSQTNSSSANVSVRIPSKADVGSGQPVVLTNLSGVALDQDDNDPIDPNSITVDVVRAIRSGNTDEQSNGFLRDLEKPRVIGGWPITITAAIPDGAGDPGIDFLIGFSFDTTCLNTPAAGDVVTIGENLLQVTAPGVLLGSVVSNLRVRSASELADPQVLLGDGFFHAPFQTSLTLAPGCWVSFLPEATSFPVTGIDTTAAVLVRFSEPMDPDSLSPFGGASGGFRIVRGLSGVSATPSNIIVGEVLLADQDLTAFSFVPSSPYPHTSGVADDTLHVELSDRASDLAGNRLRNPIPSVDFTIAELEPTARNGAIVLRFESNDEYGPDGADADLFAEGPDTFRDLRGQFFYDNGKVVPRPVAFASWPADQTHPVTARMLPVPGGVFTPLNPLGAKLQYLWRYCDLGWDACDETKHNLDVIGLSWSPFGGQVLADFYDQFEILLGHSRFLPDEGTPPNSPNSGLPTTPFEDNYLAGSNPVPGSRGGVVVHNRALGYVINPANLFTSTTGTLLIPYPFNQGEGQEVTYTWRDTAILARGGDGDASQAGIPTAAETNAGVLGIAPCHLDRTPASPLRQGDLGFPNPPRVPSYGLPLLIEIRCHPSDQGLGFNLLGVAIGNIAAAVVPAFRAYSAGGVNTLGNQEFVLPDAEPAPRGGFNPGSTPPGTRTRFAVDSVYYIGQLDTVVRISRTHTVWLDAGTSPVFPVWKPAVLEPSLASKPIGTDILIDYRSASNFSEAGSEPFDSSRLDPYGNQIVVDDPQPQTLSGWSRDIGIGDGKRFLQVRFTFVSNIETRVGPELDAIALPYDIQ